MKLRLIAIFLIPYCNVCSIFAFICSLTLYNDNGCPTRSNNNINIIGLALSFQIYVIL